MNQSQGSVSTWISKYVRTFFPCTMSAVTYFNFTQMSMLACFAQADVSYQLRSVVAKVMAALNQRASYTCLHLRLKPSSMRLVSCCRVQASHITLLNKEGLHTPCVGIVFKAPTTRPDGRDRTKALDKNFSFFFSSSIVSVVLVKCCWFPPLATWLG